MKYLDLINNKIDENKDEMLATLQELIGIRSVVEEANGDMPFGQGVHDAFCYMLDKGKAEGFQIKDVDHYGGHLDMKGSSDTVMGIVGHLDVVPEGKDWTKEPYGGEIEDGKMFGRGAIDDKGPVIAAFYAMKALKDCGIQLEHTVRLIMGLDEETNWNGMEYYLSRVDAPDFSFTPDGDFPAIHGEKGILVFEIAKKFSANTNKGLELRTIKGGNAPNMVADNARAVIRDINPNGYKEIKEKLAAFRDEKGVKINCKGVGKSLEITTQGVSAHGAKPEQGENAISIMMDFLGGLNFVNDDASDFVDFYNHHIGYELNGKSLDCGFSDEPSGDLVLNVGMVELDSKSATLTINVRYPVTMDHEDIYEGIMPVINKYNLGVVKEKQQDPIYMPADDPMIETLMDIYKTHTGDENSKPLVIGGGTYARAIKNTVAFGARFPGEPELGHQKDEYISIESLMKMTKIYADAICRLAIIRNEGEGADA